jgi:hypothetical protein
MDQLVGVPRRGLYRSDGGGRGSRRSPAPGSPGSGSAEPATLAPSLSGTSGPRCARARHTTTDPHQEPHDVDTDPDHGQPRHRPELQYLRTGRPVARLIVAVDSRRRLELGEWADGETTFVPVTAWAEDVQRRGEGWVRRAGGLIPVRMPLPSRPGRPLPGVRLSRCERAQVGDEEVNTIRRR